MAVFASTFAIGTFRNFVPSSPSLSHLEPLLALTVTISVKAVFLFEMTRSRSFLKKVEALTAKLPTTLDCRFLLGYLFSNRLAPQAVFEVA